MATSSVVIPQNLMILILAFIAFAAIVIIAIQWRKVREVQNNVILLEKEIELRKISLVEKDIESKRLMETTIPLPKEQQEKLAKIRKDTKNIMQRIGYLHSEISERLARLEAQTEFRKLEEMLKDIEKKEKEVNKILKKVRD
ncbi:MAG TPA: hypothetical protein GXX31_03925 [Methanothermobacter sp.]|uniref:Uncharacterized protein n=1 Tax=Methanothermobacter tenebrarum TaxID=680118 RepID=A0ABM7YBM6_9EURY|nr:hypothetical protein [Methanothermobacter tenebrarum]MBK6586511.1 hypothetical protein [Coprothermobacter sp.]MDD3454104.1 hypothetical protein [Methanobacteriales archaeon]BDH78770.1 hypothetical protein MTTB_01490 [Methanothermobacter tenebrarum]HHW16512.1 hypothetical protein [Methanothermobacter sp.]